VLFFHAHIRAESFTQGLEILFETPHRKTFRDPSFTVLITLVSVTDGETDRQKDA